MIPSDLALRANPFPEVTDLFCRLPLSTLFYRLEAFHLGDQMRLSVRPGVRVLCSSGRNFQGSSAGHRTLAALTPERSSGASTLSPDKPIPGCRCFLPLTSSEIACRTCVGCLPVPFSERRRNTHSPAPEFEPDSLSIGGAIRNCPSSERSFPIS